MVLPVFWALNMFAEARHAAIHSYVASVCKAVDDFFEEHGRYPDSLGEIDTSKLDYDVQIPVTDLDYQLVDSRFRVSYRPSHGEIISCP